MQYQVEKIYEADYGCEERPDGYVPTDSVYLKSEEGKETVIQVPDRELYEKDINEGDRVEYDAGHPLSKMAEKAGENI